MQHMDFRRKRQIVLGFAVAVTGCEKSGQDFSCMKVDIYLIFIPVLKRKVYEG